MLQLTWCSSMLQLCYLMPFLRQKPLAGYNHHPLQLSTLSLSALGSASTSPPCAPSLHAVALLPGLSLLHSPQLVLLLLSLIVSLVHCIVVIAAICVLLLSTWFLPTLLTINDMHIKILVTCLLKYWITSRLHPYLVTDTHTSVGGY
jgi:hypothetical protein